MLHSLPMKWRRRAAHILHLLVAHKLPDSVAMDVWHPQLVLGLELLHELPSSPDVSKNFLAHAGHMLGSPVSLLLPRSRCSHRIHVIIFVSLYSTGHLGFLRSQLQCFVVPLTRHGRKRQPVSYNDPIKVIFCKEEITNLPTE